MVTQTCSYTTDSFSILQEAINELSNICSRQANISIFQTEYNLNQEYKLGYLEKGSNCHCTHQDQPKWCNLLIITPVDCLHKKISSGYLHSAHSFKYHSYHFGNSAGRLLSSARLEDARWDILPISYWLSGSCSLRSSFMNSLWVDEYQHYTFHLSQSCTQRLWKCKAYDPFALCKREKSEMQLPLTAAVVEYSQNANITVLIQRWILKLTTNDHSVLTLWLECAAVDSIADDQLFLPRLISTENQLVMWHHH